MKVSVVIPIYNEEKYISQCLNKLLHQTVKPDEIIVVDNNSKDASVEIARRLGATVITETKQGMTYARNKGFNTAKGDILARCDADSLVPPGWVEKIKKHFETDKTVVGVSGPGYMYDYNKLINNKPILQIFYYFTTTRIVQGYDSLFGSNMAIQKKAWNLIKNDVCMDNSKVHEDMDITIHIHPYGKIVFDPTLAAGISARRIRSNISSVIFEYPMRAIRTYRLHNII